MCQKCKRAGVGDATPGMSQAQMREEIRLQRKFEFAFEGMRYWDLKRYETPQRQLVFPCSPLCLQTADRNRHAKFYH